MRIWYQSFTDPAETRLYHDRLTAFVNRIARPGTEIRVVGMTPPSRRHRSTEMRCAIDVVKNAIRAEREGYDAVFVGSGAPKGKDLDIPGRREAAAQVHLGIEWLANVHFKHVERIEPRVIIIGVALTAVAVLFTWSLMRSPWGRVIKGIREDEDAVRSLGKNVFSFKMQALVIGGVIIAAGGIVTAMGTNVNLNVYVTSQTFFIWTALLLGGAATIFGPVLGAVLFWVVRAFLSNLLPALVDAGLLPFLSREQAQQSVFVLIGVALMLLIIFRPQGILGNKKELSFVR